MIKLHTDTETHKFLLNLIDGFVDEDDIISHGLEDYLDYEEDAFAALFIAASFVSDLVPPHIYTHDAMGEIMFDKTLNEA